jgi:hypothetical protein
LDFYGEQDYKQLKKYIMKKTKLLFFLTIATLLANAQNESDPKLQKQMDKSFTIEKYLTQGDDVFWKTAKPLMYQNQGFEDGHGMYVWPPALKQFPKRIGLLTYAVFDPGFFESKSKKYGNLSITTTEYGMLEAGSTQQLADNLYKMGIGALKKEFANYGATLLTPEEFITNDEQRNAYQNFGFKEKGLSKLLSGQSEANTLANPAGFTMHYAENLTMPEFVQAMGAQAKALNLDAVLIIKVQMGVSGDQTLAIQSISSALYGPNPVEKDPKKKYVSINAATGYNPYVVYNAIKMGAFDTENVFETKEGLNLVVQVSNKNGRLVNFNSYDKLVARICGGNMYSLNAWITGSWKPFKYK